MNDKGDEHFLKAWWGYSWCSGLSLEKIKIGQSGKLVIRSGFIAGIWNEFNEDRDGVCAALPRFIANHLRDPLLFL